MSRYVLAIVALALSLALSGSASAGSGFKARPGEFVGTAAQCGGTAGVDTVDARWVTGEGQPDGTGAVHALYLQKFGATPNCAASGANIDGVAGITLTELGFDYRNDGHCGGGAPRFNVYTSAGLIFLGCNSGTHSAAPDDPANWTRVRFDVSAIGTVQAIEIVFDEGTDNGEGFVYLDNIDINGTLIGQPGNV